MYRVHIGDIPTLSIVVLLHTYVSTFLPQPTRVAYNLASYSLVLYMIYYPPHLKYVSAIALDSNEEGNLVAKSKTAIKSDHWKLSIALSWIVAAFTYAPIRHIIDLEFTSLIGSSRASLPSTS